MLERLGNIRILSEAIVVNYLWQILPQVTLSKYLGLTAS